MHGSTLALVVVVSFVIAVLTAPSQQTPATPSPPLPPPPPQNQAASGADAVAKAIQRGLQPFEAMIGQWEGTLAASASEGGQPAPPLAIVWTNAWSFGGRWLRMEFASNDPGPRGNFLEFVGLMTFNPAENRIESIWMNPRIRARTDSYIDGREMFFETGTFDETGKVLTLIAAKQSGKDAPIVQVRSTFTIVDHDHFTCVDSELDEQTKQWKDVTLFDLRRVLKN